jgi:hypothetical protein
MTQPMTLERKAVRACRTEASRARMGDAFVALCNARLARNAYKGMRRAHRRAVTLLAEYLGVGEPYSGPVIHLRNVTEGWPAFRRELGRDRCMP